MNANTTTFRDYELQYINFDNGLIMYNIDQIIREYYIQSHNVESESELKSKAITEFKNIYRNVNALATMKEVSARLEMKGIMNKLDLVAFDTSSQANNIRSIAKELNVFYYDEQTTDLFALPVIVDYFLITRDRSYYNIVHKIMDSIEECAQKNEIEFNEMIDQFDNLIPNCNKTLVDYYAKEIKAEKKKLLNEINEYIQDYKYLDCECEFYDNFMEEIDNLFTNAKSYKQLMNKLDELELAIDDL